MKHLHLSVAMTIALASHLAVAGGHNGNSPMTAHLGTVSGNKAKIEALLSRVDIRQIEALLTKDGNRVTSDQIYRFYLRNEGDAPTLSNLEAIETWDRIEIPVLDVKKLEIRGPVGE